jgi:hypothetical protein
MAVLRRFSPAMPVRLMIVSAHAVLARDWRRSIK